MAKLTCDNCKSEDKNRIFVQCSGCSRWYCSHCGKKGDRCPACRKGFLQHP